MSNPKTAGLARGREPEAQGIYKGRSVIGARGAIPLRLANDHPVLEDDLVSTFGASHDLRTWSDVVIDLRVDQCRKWVFNPRHAVIEGRIPELAKLIRDLGQLDPIIVSEASDGSGMHDILCGQRRWLAIRDSGYNGGIIKAKVVPKEMPFEVLMQLAVDSQANTDPLRDIDYALTVIALEREGRNPEMVLGKVKGTISKLRQIGKLPDRILEIFKGEPDKFSVAFGYEIVQVLQARDELIAFDFAIDILSEDMTVIEASRRAKELIGGEIKQTRRPWVTWRLESAGRLVGSVKARETTGEVAVNLRGITPQGLARIRATIDEVMKDPGLLQPSAASPADGKSATAAAATPH